MKNLALIVTFFLAIICFNTHAIDNYVSQDVVKNFITNSGFENGYAPHKAIPSSALTIVSSPMRSGSKSAHFVSSTASGTYVDFVTDVLPVGETYDSYFYYRSVTATTTISIRDQFNAPIDSFEIYACATWCKSPARTLTGGQKYFFHIEGITDVYLDDLRSEKAPSLGSVMALAPIVSSNVSGGVQLSCNLASGSQSGCLSSSDWSLFNSKLAVSVTNAKVDDIIKWNGSSWYNARNTQPIGQSTDYFPDSSASDLSDYKKILKFPVSSTQTIETVTATLASPTLVRSFATDFQIGNLGIIEAGTWEFDTYGFSSVSNGDTYFRYEVYARSSTGTETLLFWLRSDDIDSSDASQPWLSMSQSVQPSFIVNSSDRIVIKYYAVTTSDLSPNLSLIYNGDQFYSHIRTPIVGRHNDQSGLQGGSSLERYHLTLGEYNLAKNPVNGVLNGYSKLSYEALTQADSILSAIGKLEGRFDTLGGGIAGSGTATYIPRFQAGSILENSSLTDTGTQVNLNNVDVGMNVGKFFYMGDSTTENSIRFSNSSGVLIIEKRVGGAWIQIVRFDNN